MFFQKLDFFDFISQERSSTADEDVYNFHYQGIEVIAAPSVKLQSRQLYYIGTCHSLRTVVFTQGVREYPPVYP